MKHPFTILLGVCMLLLSTSCVTAVRPRYEHTKTVVVNVIPKHHKVVYIKGYKYYTWEGKHYKKTRKGYVRVKFSKQKTRV